MGVPPPLGSPAGGFAVGPGAPNFMYSVAAPVFYPPAAYGVSPSVVGMSGTPVSKLHETVRAQIDYYFSVGNLVRDLFLRSKMSSEVRVSRRRAADCSGGLAGWLAAWLAKCGLGIFNSCTAVRSCHPVLRCFVSC
jgi:hypothetical protein